MDKQRAEKILRSNPRVDVLLVQDYRRLASELAKLGVKTKTTYRIEPPLGGAIPPIYELLARSNSEERPGHA